MPRLKVPAALSTRPHTFNQKQPVAAGQPRLWNAKRRIKTGKGLTPGQCRAFLKNPLSEEWRKHVSPDVMEFIDKNPLTPQAMATLFRSPSRYFSRPYNVPVAYRPQLYFPDVTMTLLRTPHLPPRYASFRVPLWFNKLDMKDYLLSVYDVEVIHVRSYVQISRPQRKQPTNPRSQGKLYRPASQKKMTVQLVKPFVWPDEITNLSGWEKSEYYRSVNAQLTANRRDSEYGAIHDDPKHRRSIAEQARALLQGKAQWKPTWQNFPRERKILEPYVAHSSGVPRIGASP